MQGRGVIYIVWGDKAVAALERSIASVQEYHPELPVHVERLKGENPSLLDKSRVMDFSPFAETLLLDADTVVLDRLDFGFDMAIKHGLACSICENPWARRYGGLSGEIIEYNTGVIFFTEKARPVMEAWKACAWTVDSSIIHIPTDGEPGKMHVNDQGGFAKAIVDTGFSPLVLPMNWNFRPAWHKSFFGPIKIWHDYDDVPEALRQLNATYRRADSIIQYHEMQRSKKSKSS